MASHGPQKLFRMALQSLQNLVCRASESLRSRHEEVSFKSYVLTHLLALVRTLFLLFLDPQFQVLPGHLLFLLQTSS